MISFGIRKAVHLFQTYVVRRIGNDPSPIAFWYIPEPIRITGSVGFDRYCLSALPSPHYLIDYTQKLQYPCLDGDGLPVLNYGPPIGRQLNPEAAFQFALGMHDLELEKKTGSDLSFFLGLCERMLERQDHLGRWPYSFGWYGSPDPWFSALAQSRGASVMLRAWLLTHDVRFRDSALRAISLFGKRTTEGGFLAFHRQSGAQYFEEYPYSESAVLNGFIASLFGLFEVHRWLGDEEAGSHFRMGLSSLEQMLPTYTTRLWSLYDHDQSSPMQNPHSPRYHRMVIGYLQILEILSGNEIIKQYRLEWEKRDRLANRAVAITQKLIKKIVHH